MSTLKMQESTPHDELTELRKQATHKDNRYATLENELLKKNNDLLAVKSTLDETVYKLRNEQGRALKLETDLNRRSEDLRSERLARQNTETALSSTTDKLKSEQQLAKHLQLELENYASRTASQHHTELQRLQHEKTTLEARVRALEAQAPKPSQLPRPKTSSSPADARIAALECDLARSERDLGDTTSALAAARQDAAKLPRLQTDLIAADNARLRAERAVQGAQADVGGLREALREREEEVGYWRGVVEEVGRERDAAVRCEEEVRAREEAMRKRVVEVEGACAREEIMRKREEELVMQREGARASEEIMRKREEELVMQREEALDALHRLQAARERIDAAPPLIIVSPPPSPNPNAAPAAPFLAHAPHTVMSPEDEEIVARLLTAIERLRAERDALRREMHFERVERRVKAEDMEACMADQAAELQECRRKLAVSGRGRTVLALGIVVQRLRCAVDEADAERVRCRGELAGVASVRDDTTARLEEAICARDDALAVQDELERRLTTSEVQLVDALRAAEVSEARADYTALQHELASARASPAPCLPPSSSSSDPALASHLEELEQRILRRTEQIGMQQHDIRRLETNLRVAEETIGELAAEMEVLAREKACLVEDCAQAREARDGALRRVEEVEEEREGGGDDAELRAALAESEERVEAMVRVVVEAGGRARGVRGELARTAERLAVAEAAEAGYRAEMDRLIASFDAAALELHQKTTEANAVTRELATAKDETARERDGLSRAQDLVADMEDRLAAAREAEDALAGEVEAARRGEAEVRAQLWRAQEERDDAAAKAEAEESATIEAERSLHAAALARATALEAQLAESRTQHAALTRDFAAKSAEMAARLTDAHALETELRSAHAAQADELAEQIEALQARLEAATRAITELEADAEAAQVENRGLEHALAGARAQLDEHDASIMALQGEMTALQVEHTRLEAELDRVATKHQYVEQQARRNDQVIVGLKADVERFRAEAVKYDEAAQTAEIGLSFKTVQFEQKMAMMQRELKKQQEHRQCQDSIDGLQEKNDYLEEMLRMKAVEIEENDDRFIDVLKEKKRLSGKVDSLTRKVQTLQTKLAAATSASGGPSPTTPAASRPKTPSPPVAPPMPSAGPFARPPTRIPSSPAAALRSRTPDPSRRTLTSRFATPEPPVPPFPPTFKAQIPEPTPAPRSPSRVAQRPMSTAPAASQTTPPSAPSTPLSSGTRKRRAPDDFDSPAPSPAQVIVASSGNFTPQRHLRRPTNDGRSGFTPTRGGTAPVIRPQPSPLRRVTAPLAEKTNSPKGDRALGLGKPTVSKPPMRSWLSRPRAPTSAGGVEVRSTSVYGIHP